MGAMPGQNGGANADDGVGFTFASLIDEAVEGFMARGVEDVAVFFYFAAAERSECSGKAAAYAHGISDVAESVLKGLIAGVDMTIEFLSVAGAGEEAAGRRVRMNARTDKKKFSAAAEVAEFASDSCNSGSAVLLGFTFHAEKCAGAAIVNSLRDLRDFSSHHIFEAGTERAEKTHRLNTVADNQFARRIVF